MSGAKNSLDTGTLGWRDIHNQADFSATHSGTSVSSGGPVGEKLLTAAGGLVSGVNNSGHAAGTTKAAVSDGSLTVRDTASQKQDVAELNRDTEHANDGSIGAIFDKEREQQRLKEAQLIGELGMQASDVARTQGEINATKAGKAELAAKGVREPGANATKEERAAYNKALTETSGYKTAQAQWGTGSAIQQGIQAATAAVQGLAGGDLKAALAGASAPYLAEVIKQTAPDEASRVMAHAAVAGVIAAAQGNSAAAGAAGAATTAIMGEAIKNALYGDVPVSQLSEGQKQTLVALGSLAAGLAGGLAGDSTADAVAGAQAGQNELSNNMVGAGMLQQMLAQETLNSAAMAEAGKGNANDQAALALTKAVKEGLDAACLANTSCVIMAVVAAQQNGGSDSSSSTPNVGKDLTDAEKAELGGSGSGTPGGWEPQDEENARNNEAHNATNSKNLNAELTGKEIANGHAYEKHVIQQNEFADLGIKTKEQFARHIESVVKNPTSVKELSGGRSAYWDQSTNTVVIRNPKPGDGGTAFRPVNGRAYFDNLR